MPWTTKDVSRFNKNLSPKQKVQWVAVANSTRKKCMDDGGSEKDCDAKAIRMANGVVKTHGGPGSGNHGHSGGSGGPGNPGGSSGKGGRKGTSNLTEEEFEILNNELMGSLDEYQTRAIDNYILNIERDQDDSLRFSGVPNFTYIELNEGCREARGMKLDADLRDTVAMLDQVISMAPSASRDIKAYRGVSRDVFPNGLSKGDRFVDWGFVSVSTDSKVANSFKGSSGLLFEITIKKGTKLACINPGLQEILLPRRERGIPVEFKVVGKSKDGTIKLEFDDGYIH